MRKVEVCTCALTFAVLSVTAWALPQNGASSQSKPSAKPVGSAMPIPPLAKDRQGNADESATAKLPVRRVVLYKSGVGYFEHLGGVRGDQTVRIDFTSGQLNDVLQSLTVLDLNGGRIAGVNYNSEAPLSQRLGTLAPSASGTDRRVEILWRAARRAARSSQRRTASITGRLLSVERKTRVSGGTTLEVDLATLVSDTGEVHSVEITPAVSVRLAEHDVNDEVGPLSWVAFFGTPTRYCGE